MATKAKTTKVYKVVSDLATPYLENDERIYLYQGAIFPAGLREGEVERFLDLGFIEETEVEADAETAADES